MTRAGATRPPPARRLAHDGGPAASGHQVGSAVVEPGLLAFAGPIGPAGAHRHACPQIVVVTAGQVLLGGELDGCRPVRAAIIPAGVRHEMRTCADAAGLLAFVDPHSPTGRAAAARITRTGGDPRRVHTWEAAAVLRTPPGAAPDPLHPALARAVRLVTHGGPLDLAGLAARVGMSPSRLGHLFADELGLPYPAWRRWTMLRHAVDVVRAGATLTEAAHAAGFADSAHLSRTCRATFGMTPTEALRAAGWHVRGSGSVQAAAGRPGRR